MRDRIRVIASGQILTGFHRIVFRRVDDLRVRHFGELYDFLEPDQLLRLEDVPEDLRDEWQAAHPGRWTREAQHA